MRAMSEPHRPLAWSISKRVSIADVGGTTMVAWATAAEMARVVAEGGRDLFDEVAESARRYGLAICVAEKRGRRSFARWRRMDRTRSRG